MRDWRIDVVDDVGIDIDVVEGEVEYLPQESQTNDQRAALAVYMTKGTIPGALDTGVSWGEQYGKEVTAMQLSNEAQLQVQGCAGGSEDKVLPATSYSATLIGAKGSYGVLITRG